MGPRVTKLLLSQKEARATLVRARRKKNEPGSIRREFALCRVVGVTCRVCVCVCRQRVRAASLSSEKERIQISEYKRANRKNKTKKNEELKMSKFKLPNNNFQSKLAGLDYVKDYV